MKKETISISGSEKLTLLSNMITMLSAGIPILETIESLLEDAKGNLKKLLESIREDIMQGKHLYVAFDRFPAVFNKVTVNILKASEEAGTLEITLKDLRDQIKNEMEFQDRIKSALAYPIIVFFVFFVVLLLMLTVVIPKIAEVFDRLNTKLPFTTIALIATSRFLISYPIPITFGFIIFVIAFIFIYKSNKQMFLNILFSLPFISHLVKYIDLTRFSRGLHLLLSSGITITNALELSRDVVIRSDISKAIAYSQEVVLSGKKLSEGFKRYKSLFPSIMLKIIEAGERTGTLDKSMQDISEHFDYEVSKELKTMTTLLEPIMLLLIGILVGSMMVSIIAPIYSSISSVGSL